MNENVKRTVLAGGSGFLGQVLAAHFLNAGWEAIVLTRTPGQTSVACRQVGWDARALGPWQRELEGATALVNLTGRSVIRHHDLQGPVNLVAPQPLPNHEMMSVLREVCGVPFGLPATRWMLEVGAFLLRTETELIIKSRRVIPRRLLESGFTFQFSHIQDAFPDLYGRAK